jgi:hypothetical protein
MASALREKKQLDFSLLFIKENETRPAPIPELE